MRSPLRTRTAAILAVLALMLAACGGSGGSAGGTPAPTSPSIDTPAAAAAAIKARTPWFDGIDALDPNVIGADRYWEARPLDGASPPSGWTVTFTVGWGDCQAGCIDRHTWTWRVVRDGTLTFDTEAGSALTEDVLAGLRGSATVRGVGGRVGAGPTCPVERPGDPTCAARMVAGAVLVIRGSGGAEVARVTTDGSGLFRIALPAGDYTLEPQPVEGLMGTAPPMPFSVAEGPPAFLDVVYDTGIR